MTREIPLTQGKVALVDDADFARLAGFVWHVSNGYAVRKVGTRREHHTIWMHREIVQTPQGQDTDHLNMNTLDNRRANLRTCTRSQNNANHGLQANSTSGRKGVSWDSVKAKWAAYIHVNKRKVHLGRFASIDDAARAYDAAAQKHFGEFAALNVEGMG